MKKFFALFVSIVISLYSFASGGGNVNEKLIQTFKENFPNAQQVSWKESPESYNVSFVEENVHTTITYTKDGSFVQSIRYYLEHSLPYYLCVNVKKKFPGKKLLVVTEISTISSIAYYIKMEDANTLSTVKMDSDGNTELVEKFKKAAQE